MSAANPGFWRGRQVVVTGGAGFLGTAMVRDLQGLGARVRSIRSAEHDLRDPGAAREAVDGADLVIHLAATVGGIGYNRRNPGVLAYDNLTMAANIFEACRRAGVEKLLAACSVCAYPKFTPVPFSEDDIWNGYPEESNAPYGLAKKMMLVLSDAYRRQYDFNSVVPVIVNLYGPHDNFDLEDSHVIAAMIHKFVLARDRGEEEVVLWGTGRPSREFLYVEDASRALLLAAELLETSEPVNIGSGVETRIGDLARLVARVIGYDGEIVWDAARPDGQPNRVLDVSRAKELFGFSAQVELEEGLRRTVAAFEASAPAGPGKAMAPSGEGSPAPAG
ncbi:MAG: GDP-L-fucose synthase [Solirubrobacteraceae bacterium]|jgi:GDP-L-fucose synthase|nr:GDP-L-fucose synthase [Solirubrobacteraceae bacterium]